MTLTLSEEDREVLNEWYEELLEIKQEVLRKCLNSLIVTYYHSIAFARSFEDFSPANVRREGLITILTRRALQFFGLNIDQESCSKKKKHKKYRASLSQYLTRSNGVRLGRRTLKMTVFPFYLLLLLLIYLKKPEKNVKNKYNP